MFIVDAAEAHYRDLEGAVDIDGEGAMDQIPIAERMLQADETVLMCRFFTPAREDIGFRCRYEISSSDSARECGDAMGEDGVQALLNAMAKARCKLEDWPSQVTWLGSQHLGLPGLDSALNEFTPAGRWFTQGEND